MRKTTILKLKKLNGKLVGADGLMQHKFQEFVKSLKEGDKIDIILEFVEPDNTKAQLAKIHAMIKDIADETGEDVKKTKQDIKDRCGLTYYADNKKYYKSFANLSRQDLSDVIEQMYVVGEFLNINFRSNYQE